MFPAIKERHQSEIDSKHDPHFQDAHKFVRELLTARVVYRQFHEQKGFVKVNENQPYSIRGYFIPAQGSSYQFMTYNPIRQVYEISSVSALTLLQLLDFN